MNVITDVTHRINNQTRLNPLILPSDYNCDCSHHYNNLCDALELLSYNRSLHNKHDGLLVGHEIMIKPIS